MDAIRHAERGDADALLAAYAWLFEAPGSVPPGWDPDAARERILATIDSEGSALFVAEADGELTGLCSAYLDLESVRFGRRCWVEDLVVHGERRSAGTGKGLLDAAKDWARERGASHLELDSGVARRDAHRFYERENPSWESRCYAWAL